MRLLIDNNLSPRLVNALTADGWDVTHVRALGLHSAPDELVLQTAQEDNRILVSADTDFGALLAASRAAGPSMVLVRRVAGWRLGSQRCPVILMRSSSGTAWIARLRALPGWRQRHRKEHEACHHDRGTRTRTLKGCSAPLSCRAGG